MARVSPSSAVRRFRYCLLCCALYACGDCGAKPAGKAPAAVPAAAAKPGEPKPLAQPASTGGAEPAAGDDQPLIACSIAPAAMVSEVLQLPDLELTGEKITGKATLCEYKPPNVNKFVSIRFERGYDADKFEGSKSAFTEPVDIPGIGERAFTASLPMLGPNTPYGINSIAVLKNRTHVTISAPVVPDRILYLAKDLLHGI